MSGLEKFETSLEIIKNTLYKCKSCGEVIRMRENSSRERLEKYVLAHLKTCECDHSWSNWKDSNIGTWPDTEMMTWRTCAKCNDNEYL